MPNSLTGDRTGISDGQTAAANVPADGDPANAASVQPMFQYLLNRAKYLLDYSTFAHTSSELQHFVRGITLTADSDLDAQWAADRTPTDNVAGRVLIGTMRGPAGNYGRLYMAPAAWELTWNARWNGTTWVRDTANGSTLIAGAGAGLDVWTADSGAAGSTFAFAGMSRLRGHGTSFNTAVAMPKAWGRIYTNGGGAAAVDTGYNVSAVSTSGNDLLIDFATPMSSGSYVAVASMMGLPGAANVPFYVGCVPVNASRLALGAIFHDGTARSFSTTENRVGFTVFG